MNGPPPRLRDDAAIGAGLRADLARAETSVVQRYDTEKGLARLRAAIAVGAAGESGQGGADTGATSTGAGSSALVAKWAGLALVGAALVGGGLALRGRAPEPAKAPATTVTAPAPPAPVSAVSDPKLAEPVPAKALAASAPGEVLPEPPSMERAAEARPEARAGRERPARRAIDPDDALRRETAELAEARRLLVRDPRGALALVERGNTEFPRGMFGEEREAIAILALVDLGQTSTARRRASAFLARYPHGPFSERIRGAASGGPAVDR